MSRKNANWIEENWMGLMLSLFFFVGLPFVALNMIGAIPETELVYPSSINDFDVSSGGFLSPTYCTILFEDGSKVVREGAICGRLEKGKYIAKACRGNYFKICNTDVEEVVSSLDANKLMQYNRIINRQNTEGE